MTKSDYKPEIDGLRAIAVLAVIIFHMNEPWLPNGYIGVDIFLVISGYLITNIIVKSVQNNKFSLVQFYIRRIKRIIPLTYITLAAVLVAGYFLLPPLNYRAEANSTLTAIAFIANFRFSLMGGYFVSENSNALLHLWSLSLEEQFYFIWPLFILILYKLRILPKFFLICLGLTVASISLSYFFLKTPSLIHFSYFILPTRMAGLLIGASLCFIPFPQTKKLKNAFSLAGFLLIFLSFIVIDNTLFPGFFVLLPCLGGAFLILASDSPLNKSILSNKPALFIGKISFSLYMWHWPLLVLGRVAADETLINCLIFIILLFAISTLSYIFIENYFRKLKWSSLKVFLLLFVLPFLFLATVSFFISKSNGLPSRFNLTKKMTRVETVGCKNSLLKDLCYLSESQKQEKKLLVIGDSHGSFMGNFVRLFSKEHDLTALNATASACAFYRKEFKNIRCEKAKQKIQSILNEQNISYILIVRRTDESSEDDIEILLEYTKNLAKDYKIIFLKQIPKFQESYFKDFVKKYANGEVQKTNCDMDFNFLKHSELINSLNQNKNIFVLDVESFFKVSEGCYRILDENDFPLYLDDDHLNAYGAEWLFSKHNQTEDAKKLLNFLEIEKSN